MKIGMSIYSYGADLHSGRISVFEAVEHAASLGCEGVEIIGDQHLPNWPNPLPTDVVALRKHVESFGMVVTCFSTYLMYKKRPDKKQTIQERITEASNHILIASMLGAKLCRPIHLADTQEDLINIIKGCLPVLEENNITWVVEVHSPFPPSYYNEVIQTIDSPYVRLLPDFSIWQTSGLPSEFSANSIETFKEILPYTAYVHGKAHVFDENGEEPGTPYKELLQALKDANYDGFIAAEYEGWLMQPLDSKTITEKHINLIKKYGK